MENGRTNIDRKIYKNRFKLIISLNIYIFLNKNSMSKYSFLGKLLKEIENENDSIINSNIISNTRTNINSNTISSVGFNSEISNILDNMLFLGSQHSSRNDAIIEKNIKHIVSIGCNPVYSNMSYINNYKFEIDDHGNKENVELFFNKIIPEIHNIINNALQNNEEILVHCLAGRSRSAIVIITWLMKYKNMDYDTAFIYVKEKRPVISPNIHFIDYIKSVNK